MDAVLTLERKKLLRQVALERRNSLAAADACLWSLQIQARVLALDCFRTASTIAIYSPIQNEVDTCGLLDHTLASGKGFFCRAGLGRNSVLPKSLRLPNWPRGGLASSNRPALCV